MFTKLFLLMCFAGFSYQQNFRDIKSVIKQVLINAYVRLVTLGRIMLYHTLHWFLIKILL